MKRSMILTLAVLLALGSVLMMTSVALADPRGEAKGYTGQRGNSTDRSAGVTEDTDGDGQPNTPDPNGDADNRHPSGKDKSEEPGGSLNQGASTSTPDQNGSGPERDEGGTDKPDGPGGADILDQDMNNGCGNDDDFDDDNEGWCGKPIETLPLSPAEVEGEREESEVLGARSVRGPGVQVAGALATTGAALMGFAVAGVMMLVGGVMVRTIRRR